MKLYARYLGGPQDGRVDRLISWEEADRTPLNPTAEKRQDLPIRVDHEWYGTDPMDGLPQVTEVYLLESQHTTGDKLFGNYRYNGVSKPAGAD